MSFDSFIHRVTTCAVAAVLASATVVPAGAQQASDMQSTQTSRRTSTTQRTSTPLTMRQAVSEALAASAAVHAAERTRDARSAAAHGAWGRMLPTVSVDALYTHMDKDLVLDLDPIRTAMIALQSGNQVSFANLQSMITQGRALSAQEQQAVSAQAQQKLAASLPHFSETVKEQNFPQAVVSVKQPLFTGGRIIAGIRGANALEDAAAARLDETRGSVTAEAAVRYLDVLLAAQNTAVRRDALDGIRRHQQRAARMMEQGVIARHDKLRADVALAEAERALFEAEQKLAIARTALASVLGRSDDDIITADSLHAPVPAPALEALIDESAHDNALVRTIDAGARALREKQHAALGEYFPTVFAFGMYNVFDHYMVPGLEPKWAAGVGASWTLFDGMSKTRGYQSAGADADAMEETAREARRKIRLAVRSACMNAALASARAGQLASAEEQADESLRLNEKRYETGLGTSLEVVDAQLALEGIRLQRLQALRDHHASVLSALEAAGHAADFADTWERR